MKICYNVSAMIANNALSKTDDRLTQSLQRLSSGLKIVNSKDNPSGMAMGKRMDAQIAGIAVATQNSSDGISIIETADGALSEIHDILQRLNELALKGSNGTITDSDRDKIDDEMKQMKEEITRISQTTQFNGQNLLDGSFDLKGYANMSGVKVGYYSDEVIPRQYTISALKVDFNADGTIANVDPAPTFGAGFPADARVDAINGNFIKIKGSNNFEIDIRLDKNLGGTGVVIAPIGGKPLNLDITGIGSMDMQVGANEGQILGIRIPTISLEQMGIEDIDYTTEASTKASIDKVSNAVSYISESRSRLGAYQNRLEHGISSLDVTSENMTAAYSRIMDVDMAKEMTEYTTLQVLSQSSMSMLAQANERPAQVLQLLQ